MSKGRNFKKNKLDLSSDKNIENKPFMDLSHQRWLMLFIRFFLLLLVGFNAAAKPISYHLPFIDESIKIDGKLTESAWSKAAKIELKFENSPGDNIPVSVKTSVLYFEDGNNLNVAFIAFEQDPKKIRANYNDRDDSWDDDMVSIMIDTFNDERRAYQFFINPFGVQADSIINEVNGTEDLSWNGIWESAGEINQEGFIVEFSIPLRILRFNQSLNSQIWGIEFIRFRPRENRYRYSTVVRPRGSPCGLCLLEKMEGFSKIELSNNLDVIPTLTLSNSKSRADVTLPNWDSSGTRNEVGADVRWGINQDMVLNATLNPDFSQVEVDSAQLAVNTKFSLFFPEKRTFFLDGADFFETPSRFVHTRNIADPIYGIKLTGKSGEHSYGVIVSQDRQTSFLLPSAQGSSLFEIDDDSDVLVGRWRQDIGEKDSFGLLLTHRSASDYASSLAGFDGRIWLGENDWLEYQWTYSESETPYNAGQITKENDDAVKIDYNHQDRDWRWFVNYNDKGKNFRADLGFIGQVDTKRFAMGGERIWYFDDDGFLNQLTLYSDYDKKVDQSGKDIEEEFEFNFRVMGASQLEAWIGVGKRSRYAENSFTLERNPPVVVPPSYEPEYDSFLLSDYFDETFYFTGLNYQLSSKISFRLRLSSGDQTDVQNIQVGERTEWSYDIEWRPNAHLETNLRFVYQDLDVEQGKLFNAELVDFRMAYQFDLRHRLKLSLQGLKLNRNPQLYMEQYRDIANIDQYIIELPSAKDEEQSLQLIYSYKVNPQTLIYLGYFEHSILNLLDDQLVKDNRSLFAKFSYALQY